MALMAGGDVLLVRAALAARLVRVGRSLVRLRGMLVGAAGVVVRLIVVAFFGVIRGLAMMMRRRLVMRSRLMVRLAALATGCDVLLVGSALGLGFAVVGLCGCHWSCCLSCEFVLAPDGVSNEAPVLL